MNTQQNIKILVAAIFSILALTGCSGVEIPSDANSPSNAYPITLTREKQRVIRYDCEGRKTSDKIEQVGSPSELIEIHPSRGRYDYGSILGSNFHNETTGSSAKVIFDSVKFYISLDRSLTTMRVREGVNAIRYHFSFFADDYEEDVRYIYITYETTMLDGVAEYRPLPEECEPSAAP